MIINFQEPIIIKFDNIVSNYKEHEYKLDYFSEIKADSDTLILSNPDRYISFKTKPGRWNEGYSGIDTNCTEDELSEAFKKLPIEQLDSLVYVLNQAGVRLQKLFLLSLRENSNNCDAFSDRVILFINNQYDVNYHTSDSCPLFEAIVSKDLFSVNALLANGANVNTTINDESALLVAASMSNIEIFTTLLDHKAEVNSRRKIDGVTPLYLAAAKGKNSFVKKLLEFKASPNIALNGGKTPLIAASKNNHLAEVKLLLTNGANINDVDKYGNSALHYAVQNGHETMVNLLVKNNANINAINNIGKTPLFLAVEEEHEAIVKTLAKPSNVNEKFRGRTPLFKAVSLMNEGIVQYLLDAKADPNNGFMEKTPLEEAEKNGFNDIAMLLQTAQPMSVTHDKKGIAHGKTPQIDIPLLEVWRLFIDGVKQEADRGWIGFEKREAGYLKGVCHAMAFALNHLDDEVSIELIQNIQKIAMQGVTHTNYSDSDDLPGKIRKIDVGYGLCEANVTKKGFTEIIKKRHLEERHLTINFMDATPKEKSIISQNLDNISDDQLSFVISMMYEQIQKHNNVRISGTFPNPLSIDLHIIKNLTRFIEKYEFEIRMAKDNSEEKLKAILSFVRSCEHMHVFIDGNGRTFYMVMFYYLLIKNNLSLPLLTDINDLTGHSADELMPRILDESYQSKDILMDPSKKFFKISTLDILDKLAYEELQYFIISLKPLKSYFEPSPIFNLIEAIIENQSSTIESLVENDVFLFKHAYLIFLKLVKLPEPTPLIDFKNNFPKLFHQFIHELPKDLEPSVMIATRHDCADTLNMLINSGASLQTDNKNNVLFEAVLNNSLKVLNLLVDPKLKSDLNVNALNRSGLTAAQYAAQLNKIDALKLLADGGVDLNAGADHIRGTPLYTVVKNNSLEGVKVLIQPKYKVDLNKTNYYGETPLFAAASYHRDEIFKLLVDCGADLTIVDEIDNYAPIHIAAKHGSLKVLNVIYDLMIDKHVPIDINQTDTKGNTAAHVAIDYGHLDALMVLKNIGVNLKKPNTFGITPLMKAVKNRTIVEGIILECVKFLIPFSNCDAICSNGHTAAYYALNENNIEIFKMLYHAGADFNLGNHGELAFTAATNNQLQFLKILADAKVNLSEPYQNDMTPLHIAAKNGSFQTVEFLIRHNVNCFATDSKKHSPIYYAIQHKHWNIMRCFFHHLDLNLLSAEDKKLIYKHRKEICWYYYKDANYSGYHAGRSPIIAMMMQSSFIFKKLEDSISLENRHLRPELKNEYDKTHEMILYEPPKKGFKRKR